MGSLNKEINNVQNAALGSLLLWRFCCSYALSSGKNEPTPLPLVFIVLPVLLHEETMEYINSTQKASGLRVFIDKFTSKGVCKRDNILAIQNRAIAMKGLTLQSVSMAIASNLISLDTNSGYLISLTYTPPKRNPESIAKLIKCADKLGEWCSSVSLHEISIIMKVRF
jgi:hypothetical protein